MMKRRKIFCSAAAAALLCILLSAPALSAGEKDTGYPEKKIRAKVESLGLTDRVIFAGVQEDVSPFYQAMDLFLMPSLFEGLPLVLVEAQTSGVPCVISDKIPEDSILIPDLVSVCKLSDDASTWAKTAWKHIHDQRRDRSNEIAVCGFDIRKTAEWLTDFYMEMADQE